MSNIEEIKQKLDIVDFISRIAPLKKAGINFKAVCPFHSEKTPSFFVSPQRQSWRCFGCNVGGDIFKFVMLYEKVDFPEALQILAEKAGVVLRREDPRLQSERTRLMAICEEAARFFAKNLSENTAALSYLQGRGLAPQTISEFSLGFALERSNTLARHLAGLGRSILDVEAAGLVIKSETGEYFDRFRSRIMFPIKNANGKVVGFTGRIFGPREGQENVPKYHNSPETLIFQKSRILYGLEKSQEEMRKTKSAVLTEGQMDVILSWQNGMKNIVATSGTALTDFHLKLLKRFAENLYLAFDSDDAGESAAYDVLRILRQTRDDSVSGRQEMKLYRIVFEEKDLADYFKNHPGKNKELIEKAAPFFDYLFRRAEELFGGAKRDDRKKFAFFLLDKIRWVTSPLEQNLLVERLAAKVGVDKQVLVSELARLPKEYSLRQNEEMPLSVLLDLPERHLVVAENFLALCLVAEGGAKALKESVDFLPERQQGLARSILSYKENGKEDEIIKEDLDKFYLLAEYQKELGVDIEAEIVKVEKELRKEFFKKKIRSTQAALRHHEERGLEIPEELKTDLHHAIQEYNQLTKNK